MERGLGVIMQKAASSVKKKKAFRKDIKTKQASLSQQCTVMITSEHIPADFCSVLEQTFAVFPSRENCSVFEDQE